MYLLASKSESEDEDMCVVFDDEGLAPGASNKTSTDDWDEEQHAMLGMCAANLKRMSLGLNRDVPACIEAKNVKKESATERNVKRPKCTMRERGSCQAYKWAVHCYDMNEVFKLRLGYKKIRWSQDRQLANCASTKTRISNLLVSRQKFLIVHRGLDV